MRKFGLIGYPLTHSFSKKYFNEKFIKEHITDCSYELYSIGSINVVPDLIKSNPDLLGINVTIPYKQLVMPYLSELKGDADEIKAVNVIKRKGSELIGYNSDTYGFRKSLLELITNQHVERALILGTGGASKAVEFVLKELDVKVQFVSRKKSEIAIKYTDLNRGLIEAHRLIVNTTPLGTYPNVNGKPDLPYEYITANHFLMDLVYNPKTTAFMHEGSSKGAKVKNGLNMLIYQAERAWEIWNT